MKPEAQIRTATKDLVDSLLAMNTSNRVLRKRVTEAYARDINAGKWKLTNQGIGVTTEGVLLDGQHRLEALRICGYPPIKILVVTGLDADAQITVDAHAKRSARDILQFAFGSRVSRSAPAIGNVLLRFGGKGWNSTPTNQELMDAINEYIDEIETVTSIPKSHTTFPAPCLAAFCRCLKVNPESIEGIRVFMERVESGELLTKTMPEFHLKNFLTSSRATSGGTTMQLERWNKTMRALTASLKGEPMGVLRG